MKKTEKKVTREEAILSGLKLEMLRQTKGMGCPGAVAARLDAVGEAVSMTRLVMRSQGLSIGESLTLVGTVSSIIVEGIKRFAEHNGASKEEAELAQERLVGLYMSVVEQVLELSGYRLVTSVVKTPSGRTL